MNDTPTETPAPRPTRRWLMPTLLLALAVLVAAGAAWGWQAWQAWQEQARVRSAGDQVRIQGLEQALDALRRDQRAASQRLQDSAAMNRVLRDEMLGLGQRSALLEENVARLTESTQQDSDAVHRDMAGLLLAQALQRVEAADDLDGARHLYASAAAELAALAGTPETLNLRQALIQERNALDAAQQGPRAQARARFAHWLGALEALPTTGKVDAPPAGTPAATRPWWQVALAPFVEMTPTRLQGPLTEAERVAARDALQLEATLARSAIERGDEAALVLACDRIEHGMTRLWPDSPALRTQRAELRAIRSAPLRLDLPELGSTLQQLRTLHEGGIP